MAPIFERAAAALEPRARFVKVDVDANRGLAARFGVQGIPALFVFVGGKVAAHQAGLADQKLLESWGAAVHDLGAKHLLSPLLVELEDHKVPLHVVVEQPGIHRRRDLAALALETGERAVQQLGPKVRIERDVDAAPEGHLLAMPA